VAWGRLDWSTISNINLGSAPFATSQTTTATATNVQFSALLGAPSSSTSLVAYIAGLTNLHDSTARTSASDASQAASNAQTSANAAALSASNPPLSGLTGAAGSSAFTNAVRAAQNTSAGTSTSEVQAIVNDWAPTGTVGIATSARTAENSSNLNGVAGNAYVTNNQQGVTLGQNFTFNRTSVGTESFMTFKTIGVSKLTFNLGNPAENAGYLGIAGTSGDANDVFALYTGGLGLDGLVIGNTGGSPTPFLPYYLLRVAGNVYFDGGTINAFGSSTNFGSLTVLGGGNVLTQDCPIANTQLSGITSNQIDATTDAAYRTGGGTNGQNGTNAYISITNVVTLAPGASAYASNNIVGPTNFVTLGIPAGSNGVDGATGPQGPAGTNGLDLTATSTQTVYVISTYTGGVIRAESSWGNNLFVTLTNNASFGFALATYATNYSVPGIAATINRGTNSITWDPASISTNAASAIPPGSYSFATTNSYPHLFVFGRAADSTNLFAGVQIQ
jgi:hypothetical protein